MRRRVSTRPPADRPGQEGVGTFLVCAVGRPARVLFVAMLPKTRSGKLLRRAIQAVCEGRDPGDLSTLEDPAALQQVQGAVAAARPVES